MRKGICKCLGEDFISGHLGEGHRFSTVCVVAARDRDSDGVVVEDGYLAVF